MALSILKNRIYEIMDLEGDTALTEAHRKLVGTIMLVNGILTQVLGFDWERDALIGSNYKEYCNDMSFPIKVRTLEVFLPDTGLYLSNTCGWLYVEKVPIRQWAKSCTGDGYRVISLRSDVGRTSWRTLLDLVSLERKDIVIVNSVGVFHHNTKIGTYSNNQIICNNSLFSQELKDWIRDGR